MNQATMHLKILDAKVVALQKELEAALGEGQRADAKYQKLQEELTLIRENERERIEGIRDRYATETEECKKQLELSREVLDKKKEERTTLLNYLQNLQAFEHHVDNVKDFDWDSLKHLEPIGVNKEQLSRQAEALAELNQRARLRITDINNLISSTSVVKDRLLNAIKEHQKVSDEWTKKLGLQEKRIDKTRADTERLNMLVKQCLVSNEPTSEYVTKSIQAKCHSFVTSKNPEELLAGLQKFKLRQDRIIKLLKYKDNKLSDETNKLQVARDYTQDQIRVMDTTRYS